MRNTLRLLTLALVSFSSMALAARELHPDFQKVSDKLKWYRNYFRVTGHTPVSEHFLVVVGGRGGLSFEFGIDQLSTLEKLTDDLSSITEGGFSGGFVFPITGPNNVPPALSEWASLLVAKVSALHPNEDVKISYLGRFGTASFEEWVPNSTGKDSTEKMGIAGRLRVKTDALGNPTTESIGMSSSGHGVFFPMIQAGKALPDLNFVDYIPGRNFTGKALFANVLFNKNCLEVQAEWAEFAKSAGDAIRALQNSTYKNPLDSLLARQGNTLLPEGLDQTLVFEFGTYARHADFQKQEHIIAAFKVKISELGAAQTVEKVFVDAKLGLRMSLAISIREKKAVLTATNRNGESATRSYNLSIQFLSDDDNAAIKSLGSMIDPNEDPKGRRGFQLPGTDGFQTFDISSSMIKPDLYVGAAGCENDLKP